eukprot:CAMPEP_0171186158 /NCGR_PEP_ID=MMETSP0790-20130122/16668_1 /TAXON_ID=2925 /ORGANISM="Alexandrium catenella, Strain OF101" /LENGTH=164 /DNA_ID=CAMNT_0011651193 /DNA_START=69 /DNA_END=563 /DNA_ORIENTATION=+
MPKWTLAGRLALAATILLRMKAAQCRQSVVGSWTGHAVNNTVAILVSCLLTQHVALARCRRPVALPARKAGTARPREAAVEDTGAFSPLPTKNPPESRGKLPGSCGRGPRLWEASWTIKAPCAGVGAHGSAQKQLSRVSRAREKTVQKRGHAQIRSLRKQHERP